MNLPKSDFRFALLVALVLCPVTFFSVIMFGPMGALAIMLVPIAFLFKPSSKDNQEPK